MRAHEIPKPFKEGFCQIEHDRRSDQAKYPENDTASNRKHGQSVAPKEPHNADF